MVDFKGRLPGNKTKIVTDPVALYDTLDRTSDKGPLRPAQEAVLSEWHKNRRDQKDVIVKLHTGQGKTLIGLLMLQSRLNEKNEPVLYLCPNNFLVEQTCEQAKSFGIATCQTNDELPADFLNGKKIFVTSVHKLFNGRTKFGINNKGISIDTILMDDAHACVDAIRSQCRIRLPSDDEAYRSLFTLFASELEAQGVGTFAEIASKKYDAFLPVPYWAWLDKEAEVAKILAAGTERNSIKFAWPLLKNLLPQCQSVVSGGAIEIESSIAPTHMFKSYTDAAHRIFMSATVTDDSFLVKGLQLSPETITKPLIYEKESWSGEKMILIPSLIHDELNEQEIVHLFAQKDAARKFGRVVLAPSEENSKGWSVSGAKVAMGDGVGKAVEVLRAGNYQDTLVLVNRYDGIDLPDAACRILIFAGKPYSESLIDLYQEDCRPNAEATLIKIVRTIEQGLGRSVRGEKDYSVIIVTGADLTRFIRDKSTKKFLSNQMSAQIQIGIEIADMAQSDLVGGSTPIEVLKSLIKQCTGRDQAWKEFYADQMNQVKPKAPDDKVLKIYAAELEAERKYMTGDNAGAAKSMQSSMDKGLLPTADQGWYLQEMARFLYRQSKLESQELQLAAYNANHRLLKPRAGVAFSKLEPVSQGRMEKIINWIEQFDDYEQLNVALNDILSNLVFGAKAEKFENALNELSGALGFNGDRPDKEWKEGPDNLWSLDKENYILWECKNEVDINRAEIHKTEAEQMNRSCAWFSKHYSGSKVRNILIHPTRTLGSSAALTFPVVVMQQPGLKTMAKRVREFFSELEAADMKDLSTKHVQKLIDSHNLKVENFLIDFTKPVRDLKS